MPFDVPAQRRAPEERPRVRPSLWAVVFILGGVWLLLLAHRQEWFLGALATGTLHNQTYYLAWALVGVAYSILAALIWIRCVRRPGQFRTVAGFLLLAISMTAVSQVAARSITRNLGLVITGMDWDRNTGEFIIQALSRQVIANACEREDLQASVSVEGLWWTPSEKAGWNVPLAEAQVEEIAVGAPDLLGRRGADMKADWASPALAPLGPLRVYWEPSGQEADTGYFFFGRVNAALLNRDGRRVGRDSACRFWWGSSWGGSAVPPTKRAYVFRGAAQLWIGYPGRTGTSRWESIRVGQDPDRPSQD